MQWCIRDSPRYFIPLSTLNVANRECCRDESLALTHLRHGGTGGRTFVIAPCSHFIFFFWTAGGIPFPPAAPVMRMSPANRNFAWGNRLLAHPSLLTGSGHSLVNRLFCPAYRRPSRSAGFLCWPTGFLPSQLTSCSATRRFCHAHNSHPGEFLQRPQGRLRPRVFVSGADNDSFTTALATLYCTALFSVKPLEPRPHPRTPHCLEAVFRLHSTVLPITTDRDWTYIAESVDFVVACSDCCKQPAAVGVFLAAVQNVPQS